MPERLMGTDCKSVSIAYVGSNPTRPTKKSCLSSFKEYNFINARVLRYEKYDPQIVRQDLILKYNIFVNTTRLGF